MQAKGRYETPQFSGLLRHSLSRTGHFFRLGRVRFDNVLHLFNGLVDLLYTLALVRGSRSNLLNTGIDLRDLGGNRIQGGEYLLVEEIGRA